MGTQELEELIREADDAFWQVIAGRFPEVKSGDLSPPTTVRLRRAATEAVIEWIENNVPPRRWRNLLRQPKAQDA